MSEKSVCSAGSIASGLKKYFLPCFHFICFYPEQYSLESTRSSPLMSGTLASTSFVMLSLLLLLYMEDYRALEFYPFCFTDFSGATSFFFHNFWSTSPLESLLVELEEARYFDLVISFSGVEQSPA